MRDLSFRALSCILDHKMDLFAIYTQYWFWAYMVIVPVVVFAVKPDHSVWLKSGRLIVLIGLTYIMKSLSFYDAMPMEKPSWGDDGYAILYSAKGILLFLWMLSLSSGYIGMCELIWRCTHKEWRKSIRYNLTHSLVSNIAIVMFCLSFVIVSGFIYQAFQP